MLQARPSQVGAPFAGIGHGLQEAPQAAMSVLALQTSPQRWNPWLQVKLQTVPSQIALAFGGGDGQGLHEAPQESTLTLGLQSSPSHR